MLFDLEADHGTAIIAYVVPDSGGCRPSVRIRSDGVELLTLEANDRRDSLVLAGRHSTGQCGFIIDETLVPGLSGYADLEITETTSDILVYRRRPPRTVDSVVFRLETHLLPLWKLDAALKHRFHYWAHGIDRYGRETSTQVFCLNALSKYVSGRLLFKTFEYHLTRGVKTVALVRDPFHELAERLRLLKTLGAAAETVPGAEILGMRDAMSFAPVIAALQDVDLDDDAASRRFLKRASTETRVALSNPLVRQLTATTPDELPGAASVASALDALASFELLGRRSDSAAFSQAFADLTDMDVSALPALNEHPAVSSLGERLRAIHAVEDIIEKDLEVFYQITRAFDAADAGTCLPELADAS